MNRVAVFVDDEGFSRSGFDAFGSLPSRGPPPALDPAAVACALLAGAGGRRALEALRVYCAVPDGRVDEPAFADALRAMERWSAAGAVVVRRPVGAAGCRCAPGQKGLAVALAIDLVSMAWRDEYDVAIVCSCDQDLEPAVKAVLDQTWKTVEVAAWRNPARPRCRLTVPEERVRCHWLDGVVYDRCVCDRCVCDRCTGAGR